MYYTILFTGMKNWDDLKGYTHFNEKCNSINIIGHGKYKPATDA